MNPVVSVGLVLAIGGLAAILYSIAAALRYRTAKLTDAELRQRLKGLVKLNLIAFMLALLGSMCALVGLMML